MPTGTIVIRGARENNLRGVDLEIPKHAITIFTGVSGSGKSSIVFDTIAFGRIHAPTENGVSTVPLPKV